MCVERLQASDLAFAQTWVYAGAVSAGRLFPLRNVVQAYAWGSRKELPHLLGVPETGEPQAEMWMGAHPRGPSQAFVDGQWQSLRDLFAADPDAMLGPRVRQDFAGELPYLFKVLAVADPLSLQAHPGTVQAERGFAREDAAGVALDAPHRVYRDRFGKPELVCALTAFRALCGFRPWPETETLFVALGLAADLESFHADVTWQADTDNARIERLFRELLGLRGPRLQTLLARAEQECRMRAPLDFLASCAVFLELLKTYPEDPGCLTSLMLNLIELRPGEAIYLEPGNLHAYLGGLALEVMASSDNVVRAGLTPKHVDPDELLRILSFEGGPVKRLPGPRGANTEWAYPTGAAQFELTRVDLRRTSWTLPGSAGPQIFFVHQGPLEVENANLTRLERGDSVFVPASSGPFTVSGQGTFFRAHLPTVR